MAWDLLLWLIVFNADEEENIKTSNKCLRTSKPSECESNQDPGIATQDGDELFQSDDDEEYMDDEEEEQVGWEDVGRVLMFTYLPCCINEVLTLMCLGSLLLIASRLVHSRY